MSVGLQRLFQQLRQQGPLQETDVRQLLETAEADGKIDGEEHTALRHLLFQHSNDFTESAHERLKTFLDAQIRPSVGYTRADGQTMMFTRLPFYEDDPSMSPLSNVTLPTSLFTVAADGQPVPGPVGPRVAIMAGEEGRWSAHVGEDGLFVLSGDETKTPAMRSLNAFVAANRALALAESSYGANIDWGEGDGQIKVDMEGDRNPLNASYYKLSHRLRFRNDKLGHFEKVTDYMKERLERAGMGEDTMERLLRVREAAGDTINLALDSEVVYHEAGHALLDTLHPSMGTTPDGRGFHEAFGDVRSMVGMLRNPYARVQGKVDLKELLEKNGADPNLWKENISLLTPLDLIHLLHFAQNTRSPSDPHRHVLNESVFEPENRSLEGRSPHGWSKVVTGSSFALMAEMMEKSGQEGVDDFDRLFMRSMDFLQVGNFTYDQWAKAMVRAEKHVFQGKYSDALDKVLTERKLLEPTAIEETRNEAVSGLSVFPTDVPPWFELDRSALAEDFVKKNAEHLNLNPELEYKVEQDFVRGKRGGRIVLRAKPSSTLEAMIENGVRQWKEQHPGVTEEVLEQYRDFIHESHGTTVNLTLDSEGKLLFATSFDLERSEVVDTTRLAGEMLDFARQPLCACGKEH